MSYRGVRVRLRPLMIGLGAALIATSVAAAQVAAQVAAHEGPRLVGASSNNFPPVNILDGDGELTGFGRDGRTHPFADMDAGAGLAR